ncbi:M48 family metallopeptidase [Burkholderia gladioli]|uniref:M48 family metallopeptidase n=1 Tax=Burkholderia gladioli TaxID=28095 RepID=UPI001C21DE6B|nr:M48 family metallopeptidase [Burkholderia gladioli]
MPAEFAKVLGTAAAGLLLACAAPVLAASEAAAAAPSAAPTAAPQHAAGYAPAQPGVQYGNAFAFRNLIPSPVLEQITTAQYRQMVQAAAQSHTLLPADNARVRRLRGFVDRLAPYAVKWNDRVKGWHWELDVVRSRGTRIVGLPGGKLLVDSGLLDRLRLNDNEWGVLLAHEMAHALREHAREGLGDMRVAATLGANPISSLYGLTEPLPALPDIAQRLAALRYGPTDETEADVIGGDIAARAGFDPRAAITLWDKLAAATRGDRAHGFIYAHPYDKRRRQDLLKRLGDWMPVYAKAIGKRVETLPPYAGISAVQRKTRLR